MFLDSFDRGLISMQNKRSARKGASAIALAAAAAVPVIGIASASQAASLSELDQALVLLADQAKPSDPELLQRALEEFGKAQYETPRLPSSRSRLTACPRATAIAIATR